MSCQIVRNTKGEIIKALAPNQKESKLFNSIKEFVKDSEQAARLWAQVYTPSFKAWFGDWEKSEGSKVVDENGEPLLVYHWSTEKNLNTLYKTTHFGTKEAANQRAEDVRGAMEGMTYHEVGGPRKITSDRIEGEVYPGFLNIKSPMKTEDAGHDVVSWDKLVSEGEQEGKDGIIYENKFEDAGSESYVIFEENQIKSLFNKGQYSESKNINLQKEGTESSKASPKTIAKVKEFLTRIGVNVEELSTEYKGINAVAKLLEATINIAQGREDVALPEEAMHFAVELLKTHNPKLYKSMLNKVGNYKLYQKVLEEYGGDPNYLNKDGSKNILKLKEEAVAKVLTEYYIQREEGYTEKPELLNQSRNWLESLKEWVKSLIIKAKFNPFQEAIDAINTQNIGKAQDIAEEIAYRIDISKLGSWKSIVEKAMDSKDYSFLKEFKEQLQDPGSYNGMLRMLGGDTKLAQDIMSMDFQSKHKAVDTVYDTVIGINSRMALLNQGTPERHYTLDQEKIANTVTTKIDDGTKWPDQTEEQKIRTQQTGLWGNNGHDFIDSYVKKNLLDEDGYALKVPLTNSIKSAISPEIQEKITIYLKELINSYPEGTRFATEMKVVNTKEKGMLASTVDFIAIYPVGEEAKVDILDWKFFNLNTERFKDIPYYKSEKWRKQMGEYVTIFKQYGVKASNLGKTRMVPFITNYDMKPTEGWVLTSLEVGDVNSAKGTKLYLLPVPTTSETTGNEKTDKLITKLRGQYEKVRETIVSESERADKNTRLNELAKAIRILHIQKDFIPLGVESRAFQKNAKKVMDRIDLVDFSKIELTESNDILGELVELQKSAEVYIGIDEVFLSAYPEESLTAEEKKILKAFAETSQSTHLVISQIKELQSKAAASIAMKEGLMNASTLKEAHDKLLKPELEINALASSFRQGSKLDNKVIRIATNLLVNKKSAQYQEEAELANEFGELLTPFLEATKDLKDPIDAIRDMSSDKLQLIREIDPKFYEDLKQAVEKNDKQFFLDNVDMAKYKEFVSEKMKAATEAIKDFEHSSNEEENERIITKKLHDLRTSLDLESKDFNGFHNGTFLYFFKQSFNREKHINKEYLEMAKSPAVLAVWKFYMALNKRGMESGYLDGQTLSFLPMIQASIIERLAASKDIFRESKNLLKDTYVTNVNEKLAHTSIDKETGKVIKHIPKLFTRTDKTTDQLAKDLSKITAPWISAMLSYETAQSLENIMLTLQNVEDSKGHLQKDASGKVIFENSEPKLFEGNQKNAELLEKIINDYIYGISEDSNTLVDLAINKLGKGSEEDQQVQKLQGKKVLSFMNNWTRMLATGGKLMVAIPNLIGGKMQGIINAGTFYRGREFEKNSDYLMASLGKYLTTMDKALIDLIHPLNEDISQQNTRKLTSKQSTAKYLSTWSISDVLQSANRLTDRILELTNAKCMNDNSMVVDGKIVNIRQYLSKKDSVKYGMSSEQLKEIERTFESRVKELQETKSLSKIAQFNEQGILEIPGVSKEQIARYRSKVVDYGVNITGMMTRDDKADFSRSTIFKSFMMFKNWIPKQVDLRTQDIRHNDFTDTWEYGRMRVFAKTWAHLGTKRIFEMRDIISGNENGLKILREMLEEKRDTYYKATGQELEITEEEFFDMIRKELHSQSKELVMLLGMLSLILANKAFIPDDEEDPLVRNRQKWWIKICSKMSDEVRFYYDPRSADSITRGSIIPSLGILNRVFKLIGAFEEQTRGYITGDQELMDSEYPLKYFLNLIPGAAQGMNEVLPYYDPEMARNMGVKVSSQARQGN